MRWGVISVTERHGNQGRDAAFHFLNSAAMKHRIPYGVHIGCYGALHVAVRLLDNGAVKDRGLSMTGHRLDDMWEPEDSPNRAPLIQRLLGAPSLPAFVTDLITSQATIVAGTEAAGFLIERGKQGITFRLLAHIRPDEGTKKIREAAVNAFMDLIKPCAVEGKDGAIELSNPPESHNPHPQYCLVTLLRAGGQSVGVSAVITRCTDLDHAKRRLQLMQLMAGYFELFSLRNNSELVRTIDRRRNHVLQLVTTFAWLLLIAALFYYARFHRPM
jgi:hypothetical protein